MATQGDVADAWLPIPNLSNDEWRDFQKLFGTDGSHGDDFLADLDASLNSMTAPEAMELDTNLECNWPLQPDTNEAPTHSSHNVAEQDSQSSLEGKVGTKQSNSDQCGPSSEQCTKEKQPKRRQPRIPAEARKTLEGYYEFNPYPSAGQFKILSDQTQLEVKKIRTWFSNARSRQPKPIPITQRLNRGSYSQHPEQNEIVSSQHNNKSPSGEQDQTEPCQRLSNRLSKDSLDQLSQEFPSSQQQPLDAWMSSSMDPVGVAAIEAAVSSRQSEAYSSDLPSQSPATSMFSRAASSAGSAATRATKYSMSSRGSNMSAFSMRSRRKGRKLFKRPTTEPYPRPSSVKEAMEKAHQTAKETSTEHTTLIEVAKKKYFCTFCGDRFKNSYEWRRHEESIHVIRSTWVCCPTLESTLSECPFCPENTPSSQHLAQHGFYTCNAQPEEARTFFRKDHFQQHIHNTHLPKHKHPDQRAGCNKGSDFGCNYLIDRWVRPAPALADDDPNLHCGFCGDWLPTWEERCRHVAGHFSSYHKSLSSWWQERLPNTLQHTWDYLYRGPLRCRYCYQIYREGDWTHESCKVWSCRFLRDIDALSVDIKTRGGTFDVSLAHKNTSRYCSQEFYRTFDEFIEHLTVFHGATGRFRRTYDSFEQNYCEIKKAVFEPVSYGANSLTPELQHQVCAATQVIPTDYNYELPPSPPLAHLPSYNFFPTANPLHQSQNLGTDCAIPTLSAPLAQPPGLKTSSQPTEYGAAPTWPASSPQLSTFSRPAQASIARISQPSDKSPRFFIGFRSVISEFPTIFYLKGERAGASSRPRHILGPTEIPKGYIASLVMSSGLIGMASQGLGSDVSQDDGAGWTYLGAEE